MNKRIALLVSTAAILVSIAVPNAMACTWTPGFWKNHPDAWPTSATPMTIGGTSYSKIQLMAFLWSPNKGDAWINLMQKYIAMQLSKATVYGTAADSLLAQAEAWFNSNPTGPVAPSSTAGQAGLAIASQLDYLLNLWDVS
jgi:hypothetical protein